MFYTRNKIYQNMCEMIKYTKYKTNLKKNKGSEWAVYLSGGCIQICGGSEKCQRENNQGKLSKIKYQTMSTKKCCLQDNMQQMSPILHQKHNTFYSWLN